MLPESMSVYYVSDGAVSEELLTPLGSDEDIEELKVSGQNVLQRGPEPQP